MMMYENKLVLEEKVLSFFQPDPSLVHQYLQTVRSRALLQAEKRLMLAILEDAVTCCEKYAHAKRSKEQRMFMETVEWLLTRDSDWLFSFENICETLGMDPDYVRQGLLGGKRKGTGGCPQTKPLVPDRKRKKKGRETVDIAA